MNNWGCCPVLTHRLRMIGSLMRAGGYSWDQTPIGAYSTHRSNAKQRGIEFDLTLEQWWTIWEASGLWPYRGHNSGYVMCRRGDRGPYAVGNVFIGHAVDNLLDGHPHLRAARAA